MDADQDLVRREYLQWRQNACYLYDFITQHALKWPSYTVQWVPTPATTPTKPSSDLHPFSSSSSESPGSSPHKGHPRDSLYGPGSNLLHTNIVVGTSTYGTMSSNDNSVVLLEVHSFLTNSTLRASPVIFFLSRLRFPQVHPT